jgi:hypothetical protein
VVTPLRLRDEETLREGEFQSFLSATQVEWKLLLSGFDSKERISVTVVVGPGSIPRQLAVWRVSSLSTSADAHRLESFAQRAVDKVTSTTTFSEDLFQRLCLAKEIGLKFDYLGDEEPNKAPEPTVRSVTPRADARVAPAPTVAHL